MSVEFGHTQTGQPPRHYYEVVRDTHELRLLGNPVPRRRLALEQQAIEIVLEGELNSIKDLLTSPIPSPPIDEQVIFLDGKRNRGGYADRYVETEWENLGTAIQMKQERQLITNDISSLLSQPDYLEALRREGKPLVIVEGGAGPDLRTLTAVTDALRTHAAKLQGIQIRIIIADISKRMAALTAVNILKSGIVNELSTERNLDVKTAVVQADIFDVIRSLPDSELSVALLPFGLLSFGVDPKDLTDSLTLIRKKLRIDGGLFATVYDKNWCIFTKLLQDALDEINATVGHAPTINELIPFGINIKDGYIQVANGTPFRCETYSNIQLYLYTKLAGFREVSSPISTPKGWAYIPTNRLKTLDLKSLEEDPFSPIPEDGFDVVKYQFLQDLIKKYGGSIGGYILRLLDAAIPNGRSINDYPAPYITITARK